MLFMRDLCSFSDCSLSSLAILSCKAVLPICLKGLEAQALWSPSLLVTSSNYQFEDWQPVQPCSFDISMLIYAHQAFSIPPQ
ncbi:hypothetical protein B5X24_HaOG214327 [Helicoverpa armigera]|nr:hypothetical protein B5X24_HaOG214327 [Helicoverpa armigera]